MILKTGWSKFLTMVKNNYKVTDGYNQQQKFEAKFLNYAYAFLI